MPLLDAVIAFVSTLMMHVVATQNYYIPGQCQFRLSTEVISGRKDFDKKYIGTYHTGAGSAIAVLVPYKETAALGQLFDTRMVFTLNGAPYIMGLPGPQDMYGQWSRTTIDLGDQSDTGFSFDGDYVVNTKPELGFNGWRVCLWNHGVAQLFHDTPFSNRSAPNIPSDCATVHLLHEGYCPSGR